MRRNILIAVTVLVVAVAVYLLFFSAPGAPPVHKVAVTATRPHDPAAFTQGLFYHEGALYEGTGRVGQSGVRRTDPASGQVQIQQDLPGAMFGEGIVAWKDRIIQVTWQDKQGFVYNLSDLALRDSFQYEGEGWGLTHDGTHLILSDGTATLKFLDPESFKTVSTITVKAGKCPVQKLNELEYVDGLIYANIWQTDLIARIDPKTGAVKSFLDVTELGPEIADPDAVANGIAWDAASKKLFVTGKLWPQLYEVREGEKTKSEAADALLKC